MKLLKTKISTSRSITAAKGKGNNRKEAESLIKSLPLPPKPHAMEAKNKSLANPSYDFTLRAIDAIVVFAALMTEVDISES